MTIKKQIITIIPFVMIGITGISGYLSSHDIYLSVFPFLGDSVGYSLLTGVVFAYLYWRKSFCIPTRFAVGGLLFMNIISIVFKALEYDYNYMYDFYIALIICSTSFIYIIKKWF